jgi:hypothetical protein
MGALSRSARSPRAHWRERTGHMSCVYVAIWPWADVVVVCSWAVDKQCNDHNDGRKITYLEKKVRL